MEVRKLGRVELSDPQVIGLNIKNGKNKDRFNQITIWVPYRFRFEGCALVDFAGVTEAPT